MIVVQPQPESRTPSPDRMSRNNQFADGRKGGCQGPEKPPGSPLAMLGFHIAASCPKQDLGKVLELRKIKLQ
jgi:hypothetical protein